MTLPSFSSITCDSSGVIVRAVRSPCISGGIFLSHSLMACSISLVVISTGLSPQGGSGSPTGLTFLQFGHVAVPSGISFPQFLHFRIFVWPSLIHTRCPLHLDGARALCCLVVDRQGALTALRRLVSQAYIVYCNSAQKSKPRRHHASLGRVHRGKRGDLHVRAGRSG